MVVIAGDCLTRKVDAKCGLKSISKNRVIRLVVRCPLAAESEPRGERDPAASCDGYPGGPSRCKVCFERKCVVVHRGVSAIS